MKTGEIRKKLFDLQDLKYREMQIKIIPTVKAALKINPELRLLASPCLEVLSWE